MFRANQKRDRAQIWLILFCRKFTTLDHLLHHLPNYPPHWPSTTPLTALSNIPHTSVYHTIVIIKLYNLLCYTYLYTTLSMTLDSVIHHTRQHNFYNCSFKSIITSIPFCLLSRGKAKYTPTNSNSSSSFPLWVIWAMTHKLLLTIEL